MALLTTPLGSEIRPMYDASSVSSSDKISEWGTVEYRFLNFAGMAKASLRPSARYMGSSESPAFSRQALLRKCKINCSMLEKPAYPVKREKGVCNCASWYISSISSQVDSISRCPSAAIFKPYCFTKSENERSKYVTA